MITGREKLLAWFATGVMAATGSGVQVANNATEALDKAVATAIRQESLELAAYPDPGDPRIMTACVGETLYVVKPGDIKAGARFTREQCINRLYESLWQHADPVVACTPQVRLTTGQKLAFLDFSYNTGMFCRTSIARRAVAGDVAGSCRAILAYKFVNGIDCSQPENRVCRGVWFRRQQQYRTCMSTNT